MKKENGMLTILKAAEACGTTQNNIRRFIREGLLKAHRGDRNFFVSVDDARRLTLEHGDLFGSAVGELISVRDASIYLCVCEKTVLSMIKSGALRATKVGGLWKIKMTDILSLVGAEGEKKC